MNRQALIHILKDQHSRSGKDRLAAKNIGVARHNRLRLPKPAETDLHLGADRFRVDLQRIGKTTDVASVAIARSTMRRLAVGVSVSAVNHANRSPTNPDPTMTRLPRRISTRPRSKSASIMRCTCLSGTLVTDASSLAVSTSLEDIWLPRS